MVLLLVYSNWFEVENYSLYFELYNNMSHFSMLLCLNPILDLYIYADKYIADLFLLFCGLTGLRIISDIFIEAISIYLIKNKFSLVNFLNSKKIFPHIKIPFKKLHFLQTEQAILPFI